MLRKGGLNTYPIPACRLKPDFGDLDFIYAADSWGTIEKAAETLKAVEFKSSGGVWSFLCGLASNVYVQVDFLKCSKELEEFTLGYYSYNDFGSLAGKIFKSMGLKLSDSGVYYEYHHASSSKYIFLTKDWAQSLSLADIDYTAWATGFDNVDEIYNLLKESKYFDKNRFVTATLSHDNRRRAVKRPGWVRFLELLDSDVAPPRQIPLAANIEAAIFTEFPFLENEITALQKSFDKAVSVKKAFNGDLVSSITGLRGESLGKFIAAYKNDWESKEEFDNFILTSSPQDIITSIAVFYKIYLKDFFDNTDRNSEALYVTRQPQSKSVFK